MSTRTRHHAGDVLQAARQAAERRNEAFRPRRCRPRGGSLQRENRKLKETIGELTMELKKTTVSNAGMEGFQQQSPPAHPSGIWLPGLGILRTQNLQTSRNRHGKNNITLCRKPSKKFVCVRIAAEEQPVSAAGNTAENANDVRKPEKSEKNAVSSLIISKRVV